MRGAPEPRLGGNGLTGLTAYSGVMDLVLAIIPWGIIMQLHMHTEEKIGVALAMSMGVL